MSRCSQSQRRRYPRHRQVDRILCRGGQTFFGNDRNDLVTLTDGCTQFFDHLFSEIDIDLSGKHGRVSLDLSGITSVNLNA